MSSVLTENKLDAFLAENKLVALNASSYLACLPDLRSEKPVLYFEITTSGFNNCCWCNNVPGYQFGYICPRNNITEIVFVVLSTKQYHDKYELLVAPPSQIVASEVVKKWENM